MTRLWQRGEIRDAAWALAFALWCVAWPAGIVLAGGTTPGFFSLRGDDGLREMVTVFLPLSYGTALSAWGVVSFAAMWALLRLRRWLDPDGQSLGAIRWALSSRSLNLTLAAMTVLIASLILMTETGWPVPSIAFSGLIVFITKWGWLLLGGALILLSIWASLCLLNPRTLARDRLERWWQPFWPGVAAVAVALLCWQVVPLLTGLLQGSVFASLPPAGWLVVQAIDYVILTACDLVAFAWWFSRASGENARAVVARLFDRRVLRLYVGFDLLMGVLVLAAAVPVMLMSMFATYVAPQYEAWQAAGTVAMPPGYDMLTIVVRQIMDRAWWHLPVLGVELLLILSLGRLIHRGLAEQHAFLSADAAPH